MITGASFTSNTSIFLVILIGSDNSLPSSFLPLTRMTTSNTLFGYRFSKSRSSLFFTEIMPFSAPILKRPIALELAVWSTLNTMSLVSFASAILFLTSSFSLKFSTLVPVVEFSFIEAAPSTCEIMSGSLISLIFTVTRTSTENSPSETFT